MAKHLDPWTWLNVCVCCWIQQKRKAKILLLNRMLESKLSFIACKLIIRKFVFEGRSWHMQACRGYLRTRVVNAKRAIPCWSARESTSLIPRQWRDHLATIINVLTNREKRIILSGLSNSVILLLVTFD